MINTQQDKRWRMQVREQFLPSLSVDLAISLLKYIAIAERHGAQLLIKEAATGARARITWKDGGLVVLPDGPA